MQTLQGGNDAAKVRKKHPSDEFDTQEGGEFFDSVPPMQRESIMKRIGLVILTVAVLAFGGKATAQQEIPFDLALHAPGSVDTDSIDAGKLFVIVVKNRIPTSHYTLSVIRELAPIPELSPFGTTLAPGTNPCNPIVQTLQTEINAATSEDAVAAAFAKADLADTNDACTTQFAAVARRTTARFGPYQLEAGESLTFKISRTVPDEKTWTLKLVTPGPGEWRMMYGFNFVPNNDQTYFLRENADHEGEFDIIRERSQNDMQLVPTIFASWLSRRKQIRGWGWGLSGGMGFESSDPIVFGAVTFLYHENISINIGPVMAKQRRLNPRLDPAVRVQEPLSDEDVHTSGYRPNWFIGIGYRFSSNPFAREADTETGEDEEGEDEADQ